jgi:hypothetical protein
LSPLVAASSYPVQEKHITEDGEIAEPCLSQM